MALNTSRWILQVTVLFLITGPGAFSQAPNAWRNLFDGTSLKGWIQRGGKAAYTVEDGCIVGRTVPGTPNSFLCTDRDYENFLLELDFKVNPKLNSGVQIRSQSLNEYKNGRVHGYQVEIDPSSRAWSGGIYDEGRRGWLNNLKDNPTAQKAFRAGEWNHFRIECLGPRIRTWLNGVPAADLTDDKPPSGFIALQVHTTGSKEPLDVRWRNIRIQEFGPSGTTRDVLGDVDERMGSSPPEGALVLIGPSDDTSAWQVENKPEQPFPWKIDQGVVELVPGKGSIVTEQTFTDFVMHLEFSVNGKDKHSQDDGNSGVYIQRRYEVQILNSHGRAPGINECGAIYRAKAPDVNASRPAGEWQSYDIAFRSPRWTDDGKKIENARISVIHNGILIHNNVEIAGKTGAGRSEGPEPGPIKLQDHGNPVRFRNAWIRELPTITAAQSEIEAVWEALPVYDYGADRTPLHAFETLLNEMSPEERNSAEERLLQLVSREDISIAVRKFSCRMLTRISTPRAVPVLTKLLENSELADMARYALAPIPSPDVDAALRKALGYPVPPKTLCGLMTTLAERKNEDAVPHLAVFLTSDNPVLVDAALRALGRIGGDLALQKLQNTKIGPAHAEVLAGALLDWATDAVACGDRISAEKIFTKLTQAPETSAIRAGAYRELARIRGAAIVGELLDLLSGDDEILRGAVPKILVEMGGGHDATRAIANRLPKLPETAQLAVLSALAERNDATVVPQVKSVAESAESPLSVRSAALGVVGLLGGAAEVEPLAAIATSEKALADTVMEALSRLPGTGVNKAIVSCLREAPASETRIALVRALGKRGASEAVPDLLLAATKDPDTKVRRECWKTLRDLAGERDVPSLLELLVTTEDTKILREAERAVAAAADRMTDADQRTQLLLEALGKAQASRPAVIGLLSRFGGDGARQALERELQSENTEVRYAVVKGLAEWTDVSPAEVLLEYARNTEDTTHHVLALRGYARMLGQMPLSEGDLQSRVAAAIAIARRPEEKELLKAVGQALRISGLKPKSSRKYCVVPKGFGQGKLLYTDREYTMTHVPDALVNADLIMTAMDDKFSQGDAFITFTVNKPVIVYVCADHRAPKKPAWLSDWKEEGNAVKSTDKTCRLELFEKNFAAGTVTIGGNKAEKAGANYIIGVLPAGRTP